MLFISAHERASRFEKLVSDAKKQITQISPNDAAAKLAHDDAIFIDVREERDWSEAHIQDARHMTRGEIELEIEAQIPDENASIICYCGGGSRSALVAESLQKMGYKNVRSLAGGFRGWQTLGLPTEK